MNGPRLVVYRSSADGQFRWRLVAGNGLKVADSAEGYMSKGNAKKAAIRARALFTSAVLAEEPS